MNPQQYPYPPGPNGQPGQGPQGYPPQGPQVPYGPPQGQYPQPGYGYGPPQQPYFQPPSRPMPPQNPMMGYNPYPYPGEYDRPPRKSPAKAILIIGGTILLLVIIIAAALSMNGNNNTPSGQQPSGEETTKTAKDVEPRNDNKLDLASRINLSKTLKAQTVKGEAREQLNLSSGFSFMVTKIDNHLSNNDATVAAAGKKFVVTTVVIGNRLDTGNISVSYLDFRLRDLNNVAIAPHGAATNEILNNPLSSPSELKPGEQLTGKIIFEVNSTDTDWIFVHSETYQKTTDDTTFNVEGEIVLDLPIRTNPTPSTPPTPSPSST